ncbi:50S ribosomal protein L14 [Capronia epimyces CBS 606.96]|uniref:Large ribosomal subunit protein uL14m n=1 Tax=Capronia epimyces CBS 606.96 TaxID=1182542 RepID=W9ZEL2_9EURO|nr:50S ribosomal protein L14 [Capronia epimyces CBS 606.96]EXJ92929.1 50S ribosomal protein L14 [Capronia epimyces CBS 606.96]
MIQLKTMLNCIDNSGAAVVECVAVMRKKIQHATIGDRIIVVVQKQRSFGPENPGGSSLGITNKVRRGDIRHAVVVRAKKEVQRKDGSLIRFDDNACVLINKNGDPIGTRLSSVVGSELRDKKWSKILSLAPMHV